LYAAAKHLSLETQKDAKKSANLLRPEVLHFHY